MTAISKFSIGSLFAGQPALAGIDFVPDLIVDGQIERLVSTPDNPDTWTLEQALRDNILPKIQAHDTRHMILAHERDLERDPILGWNIPKLVRMATWLASYGVQGWWYGFGIDDDANCGDNIDGNPALYNDWRIRRRTSLPKLPQGVNYCYDVYRQVGESTQHWLTNQTELARVIRLSYADSKILPVVWHRDNRPDYPLKPIGLFRAELRAAVAWHGRARWWFDEQDMGEAWAPEGGSRMSGYQRAFLEVARGS